MPPINYSKWDSLELSDDSDIEGHPNIDKRSLIEWKRDRIHKERKERKEKLAENKAAIARHAVLSKRLERMATDVQTHGFESFLAIAHKPATGDASTVSGKDDELLSSIVQEVLEVAKKKHAEKSGCDLREVVVAGLRAQLVKSNKEMAELKKEVDQEEAKRRKKITSEQIHDGYESRYMPPIPDPPPLRSSRATRKAPKTPASQFETLHAGSPTPLPTGMLSEVTDKPDQKPFTAELTPSLKEFCRLPVLDFDKIWEFLQAHRDVYVPGAANALLAAAFEAQCRGDTAIAYQCTHHSILLRFCESLGKDGPSVFFRKLIAGDRAALNLLQSDVQNTYQFLAQRTSDYLNRPASDNERLELCAETPDTQPTFHVPRGPPPEHIELTGPGAEEADVEAFRAELQAQWEIFDGFEKPLKDALRAEDLGAVNRVLATYPMPKAEGVVKGLEEAMIFSFAPSRSGRM
ncbi:Cdc37 N terminal kinase binding-domain-containing protein [Epithele typhae]|uniref:Cdc37 N terminal kinase binding-domain-containing protein n=1 Tax=Epithele typhae TaxID=378194 RepID=UPI00200874BE|nr:Cdc37 N terminal kinase binding-domain-containing protein [Epithele typhae]KAH9929022.1 Cdc37 N terminal kinase binding-domain-containing protein [Epithele typhae]